MDGNVREWKDRTPDQRHEAKQTDCGPSPCSTSRLRDNQWTALRYLVCEHALPPRARPYEGEPMARRLIEVPRGGFQPVDIRVAYPSGPPFRS